MKTFQAYIYSVIRTRRITYMRRQVTNITNYDLIVYTLIHSILGCSRKLKESSKLVIVHSLLKAVLESPMAILILCQLLIGNLDAKM